MEFPGFLVHETVVARALHMRIQVCQNMHIPFVGRKTDIGNFRRRVRGEPGRYIGFRIALDHGPVLRIRRRPRHLYHKIAALGMVVIRIVLIAFIVFHPGFRQRNARRGTVQRLQVVHCNGASAAHQDFSVHHQLLLQVFFLQFRLVRIHAGAHQKRCQRCYHKLFHQNRRLMLM